MTKGGGILLRGTPAHSALLGVTPALPSLHIRAVCMRTQRQCTVNLRVCELFISFQVCLCEPYLFFFPFSILPVYTLNISSPPNSAAFNSCWLNLAPLVCYDSPEINKCSSMDANLIKNFIIFLPSLFSLRQLTNSTITVNKRRARVWESGPRAFLTTHHPGRGRT